MRFGEQSGVKAVVPAPEGLLSRLGKRRFWLAPLLVATVLQAAPALAAGNETKPRKPLGPIFRPDDAEDTNYNFKPGLHNIFSAPAAVTVEQPHIAPGINIRGFNVVVERAKAAKGLGLKKNEIAVVSLRDPRYRKKDRILATKTVYRRDAAGDAYLLAPLGDPYYSGGMGDSSYDEVPDKQFLDGGLFPSANQYIEIDKYRFKTKVIKGVGRFVVDDSVRFVSRSITPVKFRDNVVCEGLEEKVISEAALPKSVKHRTCTYLRRVDPVIPNHFTIFIDYARDDLDNKDSVIPFDDAMILSVPYVKDLGIRSPAYSKVFHEALHTAFSKVLDNEIALLEKKKQQHDPLFINLGWAYRALVKTMTYRLPTFREQLDGYDVPANERSWAALTESTYEKAVLGFKNSLGGHPWDNRTELASSVAAVLAVYPQPFLRRYDALSEAKKASVKTAVMVTLNFVAKVAGSEAGLRKLIPKYQIVAEHLGIDADSIIANRG